MTWLKKIKINKIDKNLLKILENKISQLAMPVGSLGYLHDISKKIALIKNKEIPILDSCYIFVFAGDHGLTSTGVSAYDYKITRSNVVNMTRGGATISVFSKTLNINLIVTDIGINGSPLENIFSPSFAFYNKKVSFGTDNCLLKPAINIKDIKKGIMVGYDLFNSYSEKIDIVGIGEMGIGNTSIASLLTAKILNVDIEDVTGMGAGLDKSGLQKKIQILKKVLRRIEKKGNNIFMLLSEIGGHEINGMIGTILAAASKGTPILVDGFIASSAALACLKINSNIKDYLIFCTKSTEPGHNLILKYFSARPILDLDLRLGEGTGAALAWPILKASNKQLSEISLIKGLAAPPPNPKGYLSKLPR